MSHTVLGAMLRSTRKRLGLTQTDAAKRAGVSVRLWAEVERGERENVSFDTLVRMLSEIGIEVVLEGPAGDRVGVTSGAAALRARSVRASIRRATWTGRQLTLGDDDRAPTAGRSTDPVAAVHEVSTQAYAIASAKAKRPRSGRRKP